MRRSAIGKSSVRAVIAATVLACVWIGLCIWMPYDRERRVVVIVKSVGGKVSYRYFGPLWMPKELRNAIPVFNRVVGVDLRYVPPKTLKARVVADPRLVGPSGAHISNLVVSYLPRLTHLESLQLSKQFYLTDAAMPHLRSMTNLRVLQLNQTQIGDDGLQHLHDLVNLTDLDLSGTGATDRGLNYLHGLTKLESLRLNRTNVSDEGIAFLWNHPSLLTLEAKRTRVTDEYLDKIVGNDRPLPGLPNGATAESNGQVPSNIEQGSRDPLE